MPHRFLTGSNKQVQEIKVSDGEMIQIVVNQNNFQIEAIESIELSNR